MIRSMCPIFLSPRSQGWLSLNYVPRSALPPASCSIHETMCQPIQSWLTPAILGAVQKLKPLAQQAGCTLSQFALAWVLRQPNVAAAIVGASRPEQLQENAVASGLAVDPDLFRKAETIVAGGARRLAGTAPPRQKTICWGNGATVG
jgi:aryl-alcohol dehydrogenase-like predicted oxidoreductase